MNAAADYDFTGSDIPQAPDLTGEVEGVDSPDLRFEGLASDLATLKTDLAKEVVKEPVFIDVQTRPGYIAVFDPTFSGAQIEGWRKRSQDRTKVDGVDPVKLAGLILANTSVGLYKDGRQLRDADGDPLTFRHIALLEATGAGRNAVAAVRTFYGDDAHLSAHSEQVLVASGWGEPATTTDAIVDPTQTRN